MNMSNVLGKLADTKSHRRQRVVNAFNKIKNVNRFGLGLVIMSHKPIIELDIFQWAFLATFDKNKNLTTQ